MMRSAGYDPLMSILAIECNTGHVYQYGAVPREVYRELMAADAKGRYFQAHILEQYPYIRIR